MSRNPPKKPRKLLTEAERRQAKLAEALRAFEIEVGETRRSRFDEANPEYHSY